jgi:serine/threonine-protein kinase HipA
MKIYVINQGFFLGTLQETDNGAITFAYSKEIKRANYLPGIESKVNISDGSLFPVFEGLLPEDGTIDTIKAIHNIKYQIEVLLHLEGIHGSFRFLDEDAFSKFEETTSATIIYEDDKDKILDNKYVFPNILNHALNIKHKTLRENVKESRSAMGLSGFQNKLGVKVDNESKQISHEHDSGFFMKPFNEEYLMFRKGSLYAPYISINEHLFMTIARDLGFDIPWNGIIKDGKDYHYVIKRYDRYNGTSLNHYDSATILNKKSEQKYKVSYEQVFDGLRNFGLTDEDIFEAFKFLFYSALIGHGDFHAKNISIIRKDNIFENTDYTLAPLYDISTVRLYSELNNKDLGLTLLGKNKDISLKEFIEFGKRYDIDEKKAKEAIFDISDYFYTNFEQYIEDLGSVIHALPYKVNKYGTKTLKEIFQKYYNGRINYIDRYIKKIIKDPKSIF